MNDRGDGLNFLDIITILSFIIGIQNLELNKIQVEDLMKEMRNNQNGMLEKIIAQNETIIKQNEDLLELLEEIKK